MSNRGLKRAAFRYKLVIAGLLVLTLALFALSLLVGSTHISPLTVARALLAQDNISEAISLVILEIRLPRALLGLFIGATLGLSGAALQGWLRNPLAEPGLIGVSGGAALGAVIAIYFGLSSVMAFAVPVCGILGGFVAVTIVYVPGRF